MRTYGKRLLRGAADKAVRQTIESRDAVLWDVLPAERVCRCKLQGSNEFIIARFPQNWSSVPEWAKAGQAVRIAHRGGIRGYVEIVGFGRAIPTPISGNTHPILPIPTDAILSGFALKAIPQSPRMAVYVTTGSVRINGKELNVPPAVMAEESQLAMNMGIAMGEAAGVFTIAALEKGKYRYDLFSLSPTSTVLKTAGAEFTTTEIRPTMPTGHLLIGYLLVVGGQTAITAENIGQSWSYPAPALIETEIEQTGIDWEITAKVKDQYGNDIFNSTGWQLQAEVIFGDGSLVAESGNTGRDNILVFKYIGASAGSIAVVKIQLIDWPSAVEGQAVICL